MSGTRASGRFDAVEAPGPLLASGRDADIFEYGPHRVLRRSRDGRSIAHEAETMAFVRSQGYPVPAVEDVSDDGASIVMERIDGLSLVDAIAKAPWTVRRQARTLADLHVRLHEISAPTFLPRATVGRGERVVHLDLHPLNVIVSPKGPVVIDWTGASAGDPLVDVGIAWVLMAAGQIPQKKVVATVMGWARSLLVNGFLAQFDRAEVGSRLREVVAWKVGDPHMSEAEVAGMWKVVEQAESGS
jgi:aminoglycoside phosphotransferase (APT) family kinase protein